jgi:TRAP-type mannitol/chloroaromatic compound transport system permease small subunit
VACLAYYGYQVLETSWNLSARSNSALKMPLWIPQSLWVTGLALFASTLALLLARSLKALLAGDWNAIHALVGARSIQEDAEDEAAYAREIEHGTGGKRR